MPIEGSAGTLDIENATLRSNAIAVLTNLVTGNDRVRESGAPALEVYGDPSHGGNEARLELVSNTATVSSKAFTQLTSNAGVFSVKSGTDASDNGTITFGGFANERMRIGSDGNVGIGTTNPVGVNGGQRIEGSSSTGFEYIATRDDTTLAAGDFIGAYLFKNADTNATEPHYAGMTAKASDTFGFMDLHFYANRDQYEADTPQMIIDRDGNVGIGTTNPVGKLDIFSGSNSDDSLIYIRNPTNANTDKGAGIIFENMSGTSRFGLGRILALRTNSLGSFDSYLSFHPTVNGTAFEAMRIRESGNVGIGTTNPGSKLVVSDGDVSVTNGVQNMTKNATYSRLMRLGVTSGGTGMGFHMGTGGGGGSWTATSIPMTVNNSGGGTILFLFNINRSSADATSSHFYMIRKRYDGGSNWTQTSSTAVQLAYLTGAGGNGTLYFRQNNNYLEYKFDQVGNGHFYAIECD